MQREDLVFVGVCDWAGLVRGKGFPAADTQARLARGIGITASYVTTLPFGDRPAGGIESTDDLILRPDPAAHVAVEFDDGSAERFYLGDISNVEGTPWECCPRDFLKRAIAALEHFGVSLHASFAQEFVYTGIGERPSPPYSLDAFRRQGVFGEALTRALGAAGVRADSFLPKGGGGQFEVTVSPEPALRAADSAVILREVTRGVAWRLGHRVIFAPMLAPHGTRNGTQIHLSLWEKTAPVGYDPAQPFQVSQRAASFFAGILRHAPAILAFTAPSVASYFASHAGRASPLRVDPGIREQGAPVREASALTALHDAPARQFNLAFQEVDATCCPHLALGALICAGVDGLERKLPLTQASFTVTLPDSLGAALDALETDEAARNWWDAGAMSAYLAYKRAEIAALQGDDEAAICARYCGVH